ncbi:MAG: accessory Sec system glycosylation chaperone GtfB, partial [Lactococcus sp.]
MRMILSDKTAPTKRIVVQNREEYMRIQQQIDKPTSVQIEYLGYLYNLRARKSINKSILILTNSDQIAQLNQLVEALPNYQFNIAARTTMSQKLHAFENYSNVQLYPTVDDSELEKLISVSSFYLDINHGNEVEHI